MSTQIENTVVAFNEVLLRTSSVFDDLYKDKSSNLVLPNQQRATQSLSGAISSFNRSLDALLIQLNDVALFELKLKQQAQQKKRESEEVKKEEEAVVVPAVPAAVPLEVEDSFNGESNNILDDINDFLSTVPDNGDMGISGDFNDNIQQLLMENGGDYDNMHMGDLGIGASTDFTQLQNGSSGNGNGNGSATVGASGDMNFDDDIFNEIDSMLNI